ncbi:hypothetical protein NKI39_29425 [Mesorhizobium sp. M0664]|uniref:hypothetical protein n=1 Tax=Mesorhizobium sp. M0664 TaxID=2956982 RepID=UPI00333B38A5
MELFVDDAQLSTRLEPEDDPVLRRHGKGEKLRADYPLPMTIGPYATSSVSTRN